jgi:4-hydroxybenzoate polyprenyltransferase
MQKLGAILKLIRWPNLLFIALTQLLVFFFVIVGAKPMPNCFGQGLMLSEIFLLVLSTMLIAASGYMINDYFDVRIDQVNKPNEVVLDKLLSRKAVLIWHTIINILAIALVFNLAWDTKLRFLLIQFTSIAALIIYSISFKRHLFIGNLLIGVLTSLSILTIGIYDLDFEVLGLVTTYQKFFWLYVVFAFLITIIRELIKDAEDIKGDLNDGCRTVPIVFGIDKTKQFVYLLFIILFGIIVAFIAKMYAVKMLMCIYYIWGILIPSLYIMYKIKNANSSTDFGRISKWIKWLTLSGILSMILIAL